MIREFGGQEFYCAIPSIRRPHRVKPQEDLVGAFTWHVIPEEASAYAAAGAKIRLTKLGTPYARNSILEVGFGEYGLPVIMIDDDFERAEMVVNPGPGKSETTPLSFSEAAEMAWERLSLTDYRLAACAHNRNPFYVGRRFSTNLSITGDFLMVKPNPLRFDTRFMYGTGEDTDYGLAHMEKYGGALRCDDLLLHFSFYQAGGNTEAREKADAVVRTYEMLREKWGKNVYLNAKGRVNTRYRGTERMVIDD